MLSIKDLFKYKNLYKSNKEKYEILCSIYHINNNKIYDLLKPGNNDLKIN